MKINQTYSLAVYTAALAVASTLLSGTSFALPKQVSGEGKFVSINLGGQVIQNGHDVSVSSAPHTIGPSNHYRFNIDGNIHTTGSNFSRLGVTSSTQLSTAFNSIQSGSGTLLRGYVFESDFGDNYSLVSESIDKNAFGLASFTTNVTAGVTAGVATFQCTNVALQIFGTPDNDDTLVIDSGTLVGESMDINRSDFDFDANSDLILTNSKKQVEISHMSNTSYLTGSAKKSIVSALGGAKLPAGYSTVGVTDADQDGNMDLFIANSAGATAAVLMKAEALKNGSVAASTLAGPTLGNGFKVGGVCDINVDGAFDIVAYNPGTHATEAILLKKNLAPLNADYSGSTQAGPAIPAGFTVVSCADLNDDGHPDLLLYNAKTRATEALLLNGLNATGTVAGPKLPVGFTLVGTSGFDDNRSLDLVIFNAKTEQVKFYLASGETFATLPKNPSHPLVLPAKTTLVGPR